ncbi:MAG: Pycsar system effector family protein [Rhodothermales bacterium]
MRPPEEPTPLTAELFSARKENESPDGKKKKKKKKKKDSDKSGPRIGTSRGIETMFRTSYMTHVNLSAIADSKANIMISINGIIMSIILASIAPKMDSNPWLLLPTSVLLISCMVSIIYAVLAARPRIANDPGPGPSFARPALKVAASNTTGAPTPKKASILFFGHFTSMREQDFVDSMLDLIENLDDLYESMIRDIYNLGKVLARKFALLRVSYTVFMIGLALGVLLFIIAFASVAFSPPAAPANPVP